MLKLDTDPARPVRGEETADWMHAPVLTAVIEDAPTVSAADPPAAPPAAEDEAAGVLLSGQDGEFKLSEAERLLYALLRVGPGQCRMLVAEQAWGRPKMFELRRRAEVELGGNWEFLQSSSEVIAKVYSRLQAGAKAGKMNAANATEPEKLVRMLVEQAVRMSASDIHIETRSGHADVLFRINGERRLVSTLTQADATSMGRVLYTVYAESGPKEQMWNEQSVQDAAVEYVLTDGSHVQLRFSSGPIYPHPNFHIVMRVLLMNVDAALPIERMGFTARQREMIESMLAGARGMVALVGPTNSGKSTSMQALLRRVFERRGDRIKLITVEDPVEYVIPGAVQVGVRRKRKASDEESNDMGFARILHGALRQDPDVLMVGEMRDPESAALARDAVLAGRKLFTTLHAYSAVLAYVRLREIGVGWDVLTSPGFVSGIVYQRLLPVLCSSCKLPMGKAAHKIPRDTLARLSRVLPDGVVDNVHVRGPGCKACENTGHESRTVCAELLVPDAELLGMLSNHDFLGAEMYRRKRLAAAGQPATALAHAIEKMRVGMIDPRDIEDQVDKLDADSDGVALVRETFRRQPAPTGNEGRL